MFPYFGFNNIIFDVFDGNQSNYFCVMYSTVFTSDLLVALDNFLARNTILRLSWQGVSLSKNVKGYGVYWLQLMKYFFRVYYGLRVDAKFIIIFKNPNFTNTVGLVLSSNSTIFLLPNHLPIKDVTGYGQFFFVSINIGK